MPPDNLFDNECIALIENMTHDVAGSMGINLKEVKMIDGLPIGCVDAHLLTFVHGDNKHNVLLLPDDISNARSLIYEAISKLKMVEAHKDGEGV